ncbi:hypothetical protein C8A03DRAFT_36541 [Achaetomium macrosporum]|uniref:Azaphilone pigments biosynthesis cluster protein L N-terminal domain-containing protein n=1 Tax=Achaetomium macrosporum TaxID=79813 RepID=A0AAN7H9K8_9PEZI|nr:hypothetical protein C8A03DRAFT_36541 [Achaetomium macrosporum]
MDPLSISTAVLAFLSVSIKVCVGLKQLKNEAKDAGTTIHALVTDIGGLRRVLQSMEDTFQDIDDDQVLRETGYIGSHWRNLNQCLNDGYMALTEFDEMLLELNKTVRVLDQARRQLRLQSAATRIAQFRQQIQAYKDTLQLSLQTIILWNSVALQKATSNIAPDLEAIHQEIRRLATNVDVKIQAMQDLMIGSQDNKTGDTASKLRNCIHSAASVLSAASTIRSEEALSDDGTTAQSLDWPLLSSSGSQDDVMAWINSSTVDLSLAFQRQLTPAGPSILVSSIDHRVESETSLRASSPPQRQTSTQRSFASMASAEIPSRNAPVTSTLNATSSMNLHQPEEPPRLSAPLPECLPTSEAMGVSSQQQATPVSEEAAPQQTAITTTHKRSRSRLSRLFAVRWGSDSPSAGPRSKAKKGRPQGVPQYAEYRRKLCFIGDGACGKTCLIIAASKGSFPEVYVPTVFENYVCDAEANGKPVELALWDTAGQEDYDRLRPLSYPDTHGMVLCFAIDSPDSLWNVLAKWIFEAAHFCKEVPVFLVGCKHDLREDPKTIGELIRTGQRPGLTVAGLIGARCYFETSAKTRHGIDGSDGLMDVLAQEVLTRCKTSPLPHSNRDDIRSIIDDGWTPGWTPVLRQMERHSAKYVPSSGGESATGYWRLASGGQHSPVSKGSNTSNLSGFFRRSS